MSRRPAEADDPPALASGGLAPAPHLMGVHEVHDEVEVPVHGLVLGQLRLHLVQPVDQGLQSVHELARKQQGLLQLVLPEKSTQTSLSAEIPFLRVAHSSDCGMEYCLSSRERALHAGLVCKE